MKIIKLVDPRVVFAVFSISSFAMWYFTPIDWFIEWGVYEKADSYLLFSRGLLAFVLFLLGSSLFDVFGQKNGHLIPVCNTKTHKVLMIATITSTAALLLIFINLALKFGPSSIINPYAFRKGYIGGVTTFVSMAGIGVSLYGTIRLVEGERMNLKSSQYFFLIMLGNCFYRAFVGAERIAIIVPLLSLFISFLIVRVRYLRAQAVLLFMSVLLVVLTSFSCFEYFRSYSFRVENGEMNKSFVEYNTQRFLLYFSLAVNTSGIELEYVKNEETSVPIFFNTCQPLYKVIFEVLRIEKCNPINKGPLSYHSKMTQDGVYNPEFNNRWGVTSPFVESFPTGAFFFIIWGYFSRLYYFRAVILQTNAFDLTVFCYFTVGLIDNCLRVSLLGSVSFMLPLMAFLFLVRNPIVKSG